MISDDIVKPKAMIIPTTTLTPNRVSFLRNV